MSAPAPPSVTVSPTGNTIVERRTVTSSDDAEENPAGSITFNNTDLELVRDSTDQIVGIRWTLVAIPPGAIIKAAYVQFAAKDSQSESTDLTIRGEASGNAPPFGSTPFNISSRPLTTAAVSWSPLPWTAGDAGTDQRTPDLSSVIEEIVNRPGWTSGSAIALVVSGTGRRTAWAYNGNHAAAPLLHVEYVKPPTDLAPVAALTVTQPATPPLTVDADASGSTDSDLTPIATYHFDFGDGTPVVTTTAPTAAASHTYAAAGTYTVTLTATDSGGKVSAPTATGITVNPPDSPPTAGLTVTQPATPPLTVNADGSTSTDTDFTPIATYRFDFGDGTAPVTTTAPTATASHTYAAAGTYTVTLTATDSGGSVSAPVTSSITVVADLAPVAALTVTQPATPPLTVDADASGSTDTDLTPIATYHFDFGDGTPVATTTAPTAAASHTYSAAGTYTVTLTATDSGGKVSTPVTSSITVVADLAPVAALTVTQPATPPLTVDADASGSTDSDLTPIATYHFDFGDGTPVVTTTAPTAAASHTYAAAGTYTVTLTATDSGGKVSAPTATGITVNPPDSPPTAGLTVTQPATPPLTVNADGSTSTDTDFTPIATYRFDFGDGTAPVTTTAPTATASHTYAAAGTYTVTLTATDAGGNPSAPATASITVIADAAPVAQLTVTQPSTPALTVNANGSTSTDTDLTPIATYQFNFGDGTAPIVTTAPTAIASHTYAAAGAYTITLIVTDTGGQASAPATTIVNVIAPIALERRTGSSSDDAEEFANGSVSLTSSDLELVHDTSDQIVGMRWTNMTIPAGATITAAYIQFSAKESQSEATSLTIRGQAADNAGTFTTATRNVSTRPRTTAAGSWAPAAWTAGGAGPNQRTPDLSPVIQEVVGRTGWASGNALAIIINGTGHRTAWAWDGNPPASPLLHVEYTTGPPPENPPVARLTVAQVASPPFTVNADGSTSTDVDFTPIASYRFDFGDGTAPVTTTAPTAAAAHTYAAAGTYAVTLIATDSGGLDSAPVTTGIAVVPDAAPVAGLTVTQAPSPPLTASADGSTSTDSDFTPIASYRFDFGDGSAPVTTTAPTATASHTYAAADTYTVTLIATDTGGNTSAPVTASIIVNPFTGPPIAVYAGYYDTHHTDTTNPKPDPWMGSPGVVFVGRPDSPSGGWDSSGLRIDNLSSGSLSGVVVTVDVGSNHFALWGTNSIPVGQKLILAQTAFENFDGSDLNPAGCFGCDPSLCLTEVQSTIPVVHVTMGGTTTNYYDTGQIINTHGWDAAGCPAINGRRDESESWQQIYPSGAGPAMAQQSGTGDPQAAPRGGPLRLTSPYPNPVRAQFSIGFRTPGRGPVLLAVYDVSGRQVRQLMDNVLEAGEYHGVVDMRGVPAGIYFCRLRTPAGTLHKTVVFTP